MDNSRPHWSTWIDLDSMDPRLVLLSVALVPLLAFFAGTVTGGVLSAAARAPAPAELASASTGLNQAALPVIPGIQRASAATASAGPAEPRQAAPKTDQAAVPVRQEEPRQLALDSGRYLVQAGVFSSTRKAELFCDELRKLLIDARVMRDEGDEGSLYRVVLRRFDTHEAATRALDQYRARFGLNLYVGSLRQTSEAGLETI